MSQTDFTYAMAADAAGLPLAVSIFADCDLLRGQMEDDVATAGLKVRETSTLAQLFAGEAQPLADIVMVDCPHPDAAALATLARLDSRAANAGSRLVVSTKFESLDFVYAVCPDSSAQILVNSLRTDRVLALGRVMADIPNMRLREFSDEDRLTLLRLTEQVGKIAQKLEKLNSGIGAGQSQSGGAFRFECPTAPYNAPERELIRKPKPPLPDPRLVRQMIALRQARAKFFEAELFADPAWDMLLDLTAARVERKRVSVTSLCIASGVPPTTALRWIGQMVAAGLFVRVEDETDRRRAWIDLSDNAMEALARYFAQLGSDALLAA